MTGLEKFVEWLEYEPDFIYKDYKDIRTAKMMSFKAVIDKARQLLSEEQAEKPTAPASLVERLNKWSEGCYGYTDNPSKCPAMDEFEKIIRSYTPIPSDKPAKDLQGQHAQMVALARAHGLYIAADWAVKMSGKTFSEEKPTPSSGEQGLREAVEWFLSLVKESEGVSGYHRNGDIALWSEFDEELNLAGDALSHPAAPREGGK